MAIIASFVTNRPTMSETRTYEDFYKFIGSKPERLGVMAKLYPYLTATFLTDTLRNVFYKDQRAQKYSSIDSLYFEWEVEVEFIKRIPFVAVPATQGENGSEIIMAFDQRYYEKYDTFKIDKTRQLLQVVQRPERVNDKYWNYVVRLVDSDYNTLLDLSGCQIGDTTRFISNAMPEMHEEGKQCTTIQMYTIQKANNLAA